MPVDIPLWMVAISVAFPLLKKKKLGGTGMNILNPCTPPGLLLFLFIQHMSGNKSLFQRPPVWMVFQVKLFWELSPQET